MSCNENTPEEIHKEEGAPSSVSRGRVDIPQLHGVSEAVRKILTRLDIQNILEGYRTLLASVSNSKGKTTPDTKSGVDYKIPYVVWNAFYLRKTGQKRETTLKEHRRYGVRALT